MRALIALLLLAFVSFQHGRCARVVTNTSVEGEDSVEDELLKPGDCKNPTFLWREATKGLKAEGNYGKVVEVQKAGGNCRSVSSRTEFFMLKHAKTTKKYVIESIKNEINAMLAAKACPGVMQVIEDKPCEEREGPGKAATGKDACNTEKQKTFAEWKRVRTDNAAFVMRKMNGGTLEDWNWIDFRGQALRGEFHYTCGAKLVAKVGEALTCLHNAGWIHGDVKLDNIFLSEVPNNCKGNACCPQEVYLADLGLAKEIGSIQGQYETGYGCSGHLPGGMFGDAPSDGLGITTGQEAGDYVTKADIDWCSFNYLVKDKMKLTDANSFPIPAGCGSMGRRGTCE